VGHGRRLTGGPRRGHRRRVADLPSRRVRRGRQGADLSDPHLATGEGAEAVDGVTRARVGRSPSLEPPQRPLGAVGRPHGQHPRVVLAQRQCALLAAHAQDSPNS
jgi:hypothetical protein